MQQRNIHENFARAETASAGSERSFGYVMTAAFSLLTGINFWSAGQVWPWMGALSMVFLAVTLAAPRLLKPLNWVWFRFGLLLHAITNPIVMGVLFFVAVVPTGLIMRALGSNLLHLHREPDTDSYWIIREPRGPSPESMKDQF